MNPPTVAVIGLGKVGLPLAAALASRGLSVRGFDPDPGRRALLRSHDPAQPEIRYERGLSEALRSSADRLRPADTVAEAVADAAVALVIVPTPSLADGRFCNAAVASAFRAIGESGTLPDGLVVNLVSTVSPGAIGTELQPLLEATAGRRCGHGISLCYSPALIALGNVLEGFLRPDFAFIGEVDAPGADRLEALFRDQFIPDVPIRRLSAQGVEIAKIAINNFLTTKISFANLIGQLCERTPGADVDAVLGALGSDSRIGPRCLHAGMGYGGPCLPRDTAALSASLAGAGLGADLPTAVEGLNRGHVDFLARLDGPVQGRQVTVLGLGYKAGSNVTMDSAAIELCNRLAELGAVVTAADSQADAMDLGALAAAVRVTSRPETVLPNTELLLLTGSDELPVQAAAALPASATVVDLGGRYEAPQGRPVRRFVRRPRD